MASLRKPVIPAVLVLVFAATVQGLEDLLGEWSNPAAGATAPIQPDLLPPPQEVLAPPPNLQTTGKADVVESSIDHIAEELAAVRGQVSQREQALAAQNAQLKSSDQQLRESLGAEQKKLQQANENYERSQQQQQQTAAQLSNLQAASRKLVGQYRMLQAKEGSAEKEQKVLEGQNAQLRQENQRLVLTLQRIRRAQAMMSSELDGVPSPNGGSSAPVELAVAPPLPAPPLPAPVSLAAPPSGGDQGLPEGLDAALEAPPPSARPLNLPDAAQPPLVETSQLHREGPAPAERPLARTTSLHAAPAHRHEAPALRAEPASQATIPKRPAPPTAEAKRPAEDKSGTPDLSADLADLSSQSSDKPLDPNSIDDVLIAKADDQVLKMARDAGFLPN